MSDSIEPQRARDSDAARAAIDMNSKLPDRMKVVEIAQPGGPEVLRAAERPVPAPGEGELLIKVAAAGVNGPDLMQRKGLYPPPPGATDLLGLEVSGEVVAAGAKVERWKVGDRVAALTNGGGYAEYCTVDAGHCLPVPKGVSLRDAGGLPETFFTVWSNVFLGAGLAAEETFLVHGGAGGIGTTAIQLGKAFGAKVIATDSPAERCGLCRDLGADRVIDYKQEDFVEIVRQAGGANVILDIVGGPNIEKNFKAASHDCRIIQLAFAAGSKVEINLMPVMLKRLTYTGSTLRTRPPAYKARVARELEARVWPRIESGLIRVVTRQTFPLAEAAKAHALMESAQHTGKIVLTVG
jgi:putative PIG3 family NAD(P)H quinone oxidoreductase